MSPDDEAILAQAANEVESAHLRIRWNNWILAAATIGLALSGSILVWGLINRSWLVAVMGACLVVEMVVGIVMAIRHRRRAHDRMYGLLRNIGFAMPVVMAGAGLIDGIAKGMIFGIVLGSIVVGLMVVIWCAAVQVTKS